jgi:nitric oxide dioxygenase
MNSEQKELIRATVPILREHGVALTTHFYQRMFAHNPELKHIFNQGNQHKGHQQTALAMAVLAYAENIDNPAALTTPLGRIGHKHRSLDIRPEQYAIVGDHLLGAIREVLGPAATPPLLAAWGVAYGELAGLMSSIEAGLYADTVAQAGGWSGWRPFVVKQKVQETTEITSFYLYPADGGNVASFVPGQYISVQVYLPALGLRQPRQYSLSDAPNGRYYRISVKRENGLHPSPDGMISNHLHNNLQAGDAIQLTAPAGDFVLDTRKQTPVVLISGGVGQTPFVSMCEYLITTGSTREVVWVHGARNRSLHAFQEKLTDWKRQSDQFSSYVFYQSPEGSQLEADCYEGIVDLTVLGKEVLRPGAEYYLCGPTPFLRKQFRDLVALGVRSNAIHYEEFGPQVLQLQ